MQMLFTFGQGVVVTISVAITALCIGLILGVLIYLGSTNRAAVIRWPTQAIALVLRGMPELLIIFAVYYGFSIILQSIFNSATFTSPFIAGSLALGLVFGAYSGQTFRAAFQAIDPGTISAAKALGLKAWDIFWYIRLPQAWRHALPGLSNLWLVLLKDTSLVSIIGLTDVMTRAELAASHTGLYFFYFLVAAAIYLVLTSFSELMIKQWQRKLDKPYKQQRQHNA